MRFDTQIQQLKYKVLREVARHAWDDTLYSPQGLTDIQNTIASAKTPTMRCCIYKERAVLMERVKLAMGGDKENENVIEVIDIGCDECPVGGYKVGDACRGCIAHKCAEACKQNAITFDQNHTAHIDKSKCVECGRCADMCPYSAISDHKRPCVRACKIKAISMNEDMTAKVDNEKCVACGACVFQCPFGAIMDKSYILNVITMLRNKEQEGYKMYAVIAPAIASQYGYGKLGKVVSAIKLLGFDVVTEAALGADIVAYEEAKELVEKGFLTSSCCPAFVAYVREAFPEVAQHISHNLSPAAALVDRMKKKGAEGKFVFIGPCTAKKLEYRDDGPNAGYFDCVLGFDELQALIDSRDIDLDSLEEDELNDATGFGRGFAKNGGVAAAVGQALKELGHEDFKYKPVTCDGLDACRIALLKASKGVLDGNFIEGMACQNGCIAGAACFNHGTHDYMHIEKYSKAAVKTDITETVKATE